MNKIRQALALLERSERGEFYLAVGGRKPACGSFRSLRLSHHGERFRRIGRRVVVEERMPMLLRTQDHMASQTLNTLIDRFC